MKKLLLGLTVAMTLASQANAGTAALVSCKYTYNADYGKSMYVGVYKSYLSGNLYSKSFATYCPQTVTI